MFVVIQDTNGFPGSCPLMTTPSGYKYLSRCKATKDFCVIAKEGPHHHFEDIKALECPFDKHNVVQLKYRKRDE